MSSEAAQDDIPSGTNPGQTTALPPATPPPNIPDHETLRCIGRGSYGEVWLARSVLGEYRAVKVVYRRHFEDDRPFEREFEGIKKFEPISRTHESQVDILHVGRNDQAGCFYYVMELADDANGMKKEECRMQNDQTARSATAVSSFSLHPSALAQYAPRTLKSELAQHGRLSFDECLRIGLALTTALEHLHAHGLVHRDIKPSNIIFVGGIPKLADIGLVASVDATRSFVGTAGYLPPEGPGKPAGDLYSLGKVLYEISVGRDRQDFPALPAKWEQFADQQGLLEFNAIVLKACAHDPRERYTSAEAMHADLRLLAEGRSVRHRQTWQQRGRIAAKISLVATAAAAALWLVFALFHASTPQRSNASTPATLFILPFRNAGTNQVDELMRSRVTDAVIEGLGLFEGVNVRPRKSSWSKLDNATLMRRAAGELGARYVVTGEAAQSSNRFGLTLRLLQTPDGRVVAKDTVSGDTNNLAALELAALELMAKHLGLAFDSEHRRQIEKKLADNLAAIELFRKGSQCLYLGTREGNASAIEYLNGAVELDLRFVNAHLILAATYREMAGTERPPKEMWTEIRKHSALALQIDDTLFLPRYYLAWSKFFQDYDWQAVKAALQPVFEESGLEGNGYADYLRNLGRMKEARRVQDRAELQDPRDLYVRNGVTAQAFVERHYTRAIQKAQETIGMYPQFPGGQLWLAQCCIETREFDKALAALESVRRIVDISWRRALLGYVYARMGRKEDAVAVLDQLRERASGTFISPYCFALVHVGLGQDEAALDELERAYEYRCEELVHSDGGGLRTDPRLDSLRGHPRFQALLKKVGLDEWPK